MWNCGLSQHINKKYEEVSGHLMPKNTTFHVNTPGSLVSLL